MPLLLLPAPDGGDGRASQGPLLDLPVAFDPGVGDRARSDQGRLGLGVGVEFLRPAFGEFGHQGGFRLAIRQLRSQSMNAGVATAPALAGLGPGAGGGSGGGRLFVGVGRGRVRVGGVAHGSVLEAGPGRADRGAVWRVGPIRASARPHRRDQRRPDIDNIRKIGRNSHIFWPIGRFSRKFPAPRADMVAKHAPPEAPRRGS